MAEPVYWIGQDGNIYYGSGQTGDSVRNLGSSKIGSDTSQFEARADGLYDRFTDNGVPTLTFAAKQIADPNAPQSAPSGGGGSATPAKIFNQAGANATQASIDQIPALLEAALQAERQKYQNTIGEFNQQEQQQRGTYDTSTTTNQQNYDANFMDSIRSGIKGLGGLMSLLRGTGAGGGTAEDIARDTVGGVTAKDIRTGADTQKENQIGLDSSLSSFLTELGRKRKMNDDTLVNNERAVRRDSNTQLQDLFGKMAGFYGDVGNQNGANDWINRGAALTPEIAANSSTQVSPYDTAPVTVKAPELSAFAAPTAPSMAVGNSGQIGSGIFTMEPRRKKETTAPVGV